MNTEYQHQCKNCPSNEIPITRGNELYCPECNAQYQGVIYEDEPAKLDVIECRACHKSFRPDFQIRASPDASRYQEHVTASECTECGAANIFADTLGILDAEIIED